MSDEKNGEIPARPPTLEQRLKHIEAQLRSGEGVPPVTVRELLSWLAWHAQRRGSFNNYFIQKALSAAHLATVPDFTIPDPAPLLPSLITRIRSGCGPLGTGLQTRSGPGRRGWCGAGRHCNRASTLR